MKYFAIVTCILWPLITLVAFPTLAAPCDSIDWTDYAQWPEQLKIKGKTYIIQVGGGGGCIAYSAPSGEKPPIETIEKWGSYYAAYQIVDPSQKSYNLPLYGPEITWDNQHQVYRQSFHDGKGAFRSYDKNGKAFYKEWRRENGHSRGYYNEFGRIALEDRTTITEDKTYIYELYRNRSPCSPSEFEFTKELILEKFELYEHPYAQR